MPSQILLSDAQRLEFTSVPETITDDELEYFYSLREEDIEIANAHRGDENKLGFALNICTLRHKGWPYNALSFVAPKVIDYVAGQVRVPSACIEKYGENRNTRHNHILEICSVYGYRLDSSCPEINTFINECAKKMNDLMSIIKETMRYAIVHRIIPPRITSIERSVRDAVNNEEARIYDMIDGLLSDTQKEQLDKLMELDDGRTSGLFDIKEVSGKWNSNTFKDILDKLESVKAVGLPDRIGDIHPNLLKVLSKQAHRYTPYKLKRFSDKKKYALLTLLVYQQQFWLTDMAVEMNDKIIAKLESDAEKSASAFFMDKKDEIDRNYRYFHKLGESIYDALESGEDLRTVLERVTTLDELREKLESKFTPREGDLTYHEKMLSGYYVLRRYVPLMLKQISFRPSGSSSNDLMKAMEIILASFDKKSSLPSDAPLSFIKDDWMHYVKTSDGEIKREAYIVATMLELRGQIRSGDVWVEGSDKYNSLESKLVPADSFDKSELGVGVDYNSYIQARMKDLEAIYAAIDCQEDEFSKLKKKDCRLHPERLENDVPEGASRLSAELYSMLPRVTLSDILFEVDRWTGFTNELHI